MTNLTPDTETGDVCEGCDCGECQWVLPECCGDLQPMCETSSDGEVTVCARRMGCNR